MQIFLIFAKIRPSIFRFSVFENVQPADGIIDYFFARRADKISAEEGDIPAERRHRKFILRTPPGKPYSGALAQFVVHAQQNITLVHF